MPRPGWCGVMDHRQGKIVSSRGEKLRRSGVLTCFKQVSTGKMKFYTKRRHTSGAALSPLLPWSARGKQAGKKGAKYTCRWLEAEFGEKSLNDNGKIQTVKGESVEFFRVLCEKIQRSP